MSRKTKQSYLHAFKYIKEYIFDLECHSFMTDFELPMRAALRELYPLVILLTCWFHFTQALKKRAMQSPQLIPYLYSNTNAAEIYYKLMSLPLLPAEFIVPEFKKLKILAKAAHRNIFDDILKYYEKQWLTRVRFKN